MAIDLNADLGEGFGVWQLGDDESLLEIVTSANVACGFHAGDPLIMARVCRQAAQRAVVIGAQVGYRDLVGFGRRRLDISADELSADVLYQMGALDAFARAAGTRVRYVKPHGALYNTAADDTDQARAVAAAVAGYDPTMPVLGLPGSALEEAASAAGLRFVREGFADRAYTAERRLVDRRHPGAVHSDTATIIEQALRLAAQADIDSICLHGDTPGAVQHARAIRAALADRGLTVTGFCQ